MNFYPLEYPYYIADFTNVPMNPFSIMLFSFLGNINQDVYDEYLQILVDVLKSPDPDIKENHNFFFGSDPHKRFPLNTYIPKNAYLFSLTNGETPEIFPKEKDLLKEIIDNIQDTENLSYEMYFFLADFFKISMIVYESPQSMFKTEETSYTTYKSNKEVYFLINDNNLKPILELQLDGAIVLKYSNLN